MVWPVPGQTLVRVTPYNTGALTTTTYYQVIVSATGDGCGTATSAAVPVTVVPSPSITANPVAATICTGGNQTLSVMATGGTPSLNYQWQSSPSGLAGSWTNVGTNAPNFNTGVLTATTYYQVIVSATGNNCGTATSVPVAVTVEPDPAITANPVAATICSGGSQALSVIASGGTPGLNYQWQSSSTGLAGSWTNVGTSLPNFNTGALTATTYYQVIVSATETVARNSDISACRDNSST